MKILESIAARRSIKDFEGGAVDRDDLERLLEAAVQAPNHRMTQPLRFYVLGPEARRAYGAALGARKAKRVDDPEAAAAVVRKVEESHVALPAMLVVAVVQDENPEIREEDYATAFMGIENLSLAALELGLGTHIKTGAVMDDPAARAAVGLPDAERIVAIVEIGVPASTPEAKPRKEAGELTTWVP